MSTNTITGLPLPTTDTEPATNKYSDYKFADKTEVLTSHGFVMKDGINMGGFAITNLPEPVGDTEPATKKWVTADIPTKTEILNGFTMSGILDLGGHANRGVTTPARPTDDNVTTKKYCDDTYVKQGGTTTSTLTITGDIDMETKCILNLSTPTTDAEPATKKYTEDMFMKSAGGIFTGNVDMGSIDY